MILKEALEIVVKAAKEFHGEVGDDSPVIGGPLGEAIERVEADLLREVDDEPWH